jgi:cell wall-associated NlpC family hydrolase
LRKTIKILLVCLFILPCMAFEDGHREDFLLSVNATDRNDPERCDSMIRFAKRYLGKSYCYGSKPPRCFDCSGFTAFVFNHFDKELPHSSGSMAFLGRFISFEHAVAGDLIFFNGSAHGENIGHVGIVTETKDGKIYFIHASVQSGVIISDTEEAYYKKRLMFVKRLRF